MIDPLTIKTGADFRAWREGAGYSIRELAATLQVSRSTIERWQRGEPVPGRLVLWALRGLGRKVEQWAPGTSMYAGRVYEMPPRVVVDALLSAHVFATLRLPDGSEAREPMTLSEGPRSHLGPSVVARYTNGRPHSVEVVATEAVDASGHASRARVAVEVPAGGEYSITLRIQEP